MSYTYGRYMGDFSVATKTNDKNVASKMHWY